MKQKNISSPYCTAVIVAAGSGSRMSDGNNSPKINKIFLELCDTPILAHTLLAFQHCQYIEDIIIVTRECDIVDCKAVCDDFDISKIKTIVTGGATRQESVQKGLAEVCEHASLVAIHDAARCIITPQEIDDVVLAAAQHGAAALGVPCKDSLKQVDSGCNIAATIPRENIWQIQTPQVFAPDIIDLAHKSACELNISATDDCEVAERYGVKIKMVEGSYSNIKITTPEDLIIAERFLMDQ